MADVREFVPHRMRFTKGVDNPKCFKLDHDWKLAGEVCMYGRDGTFPVFQCTRCPKQGFLMDGIYWEVENGQPK